MKDTVKYKEIFAPYETRFEKLGTLWDCDNVGKGFLKSARKTTEKQYFLEEKLFFKTENRQIKLEYKAVKKAEKQEIKKQRKILWAELKVAKKETLNSSNHQTKTE